MAGRHRLHTWWRHLHTWWRRRCGEGARDQPRPRLRGVTDAGTLLGHLVTGAAEADGHGRYAAVCGERVLPAVVSVREQRGFCLLCAAGGAP